MGILCDTSAKQKLDSAGLTIKVENGANGGTKKADFIEGRPQAYQPATTPQKVWAGNLKRTGGLFYNDPGTGLGANCFLMFSTERGQELSTTFWSVKLAPGDYYELPPMINGQPHHGEVWYIFASVVASNILQTTEHVLKTVEDNT